VNPRQQIWLLLAVFTVAALVRLGLTGWHSLWADEVFSLAIATGHSLEHPAAMADPAFGDFVEPEGPVHAEEFKHYLAHDDPPASPARVVRAVLLSDTSPPLYYLLLYGWTLVFGTGDVALRLFSTVWSLACLPLLAGVARRTGGSRAVFPSCILFALSPLGVYFSAEGRMYSLLWFCVLATAWVSLVWRQRGGSIALCAAWVVASAAGFLTHYFFLFPWAATVIFLVVRPGKLARKHLTICLFALGLAIAPWYLKVPESLDRWRITQDWLKLEPQRFDRLEVTRDQVFKFFSGGGQSPEVWVNRGRAETAALALFGVVGAAMALRLRLRMFGSRRLLLWLWFLAAVAGPFIIDLLQGTHAMFYSRYMLAALPAAYLLAAVGLGCLGLRIRVIVLLLVLFVWARELVSIYRKDSRSWQPLREVAGAVISNGSPSDLILVHSIPSGVLGVARYANGSAALASWVGQLGMRRMPQSLHALAAGRTRILFVKVHDVEEPAPEEDWLRANAVVFHEMRLAAATVVDFRPRDSETF
jgi:Dolichyl-phosphate-mannose-protein mannosyltransferase